MTAAEYRDMVANKPASGKNKYRAKPVRDGDGKYHASTKEYNYYQQLLLRKKAGEISEIKTQVSFRLELNGIFITSYRADFVISFPDGHIEVHDVKGVTKNSMVYATFRLKKALMLAIFNIKIIEI